MMEDVEKIFEKLKKIIGKLREEDELYGIKYTVVRETIQSMEIVVNVLESLVNARSWSEINYLMLNMAGMADDLYKEMLEAIGTMDKLKDEVKRGG